MVTTNANGQEVLPVPLGSWTEQDGYRVRYFPCAGRSEFKLSVRLLGWLLRHVKDYDVVHLTSNFNFPVLAGALACRWRSVPYVLNPQGMLEPWALGYKAWKKRAYYLGVERPLVLRGARAIQALNASEAANIASLELGPSVVTIPNGIEPQDARRGDEADRQAFLDRFPAARGKTLILFLHRVDPKKGLDLLAPAFAAIRPRFPETHVIVAGPDNTNFSGTARGFFEQAGCGSPEAVTFTGMLTGPLKRGAIAAASVFVAPSYSEGFSMSVLEAMAAGLPCVITTGCNFPEAAAANAARVVPPDVQAIAGALEELLADPAAGAEVGRRARDLVMQDYTWDRVAARFQAVGERLAFTRRAAA